MPPTPPRVDAEPIRQSVLVRSDVEHTFTVFTRDIGHWWPTQPFSLGSGKVEAVVLEPREGGRVYERWNDGTEVGWGEVLVWEPPTRFRMTWDVHDGETEVDVRFRSLAPTLTRVELEHLGWERLTLEQIEAEIGEGPRVDEGWRRILAAFAEAVGGPAGEGADPG